MLRFIRLYYYSIEFYIKQIPSGLLTLLLVGIILQEIVRKKSKNFRGKQVLQWGLVIVYILILLYITVIMRETGSIYKYNLNPISFGIYVIKNKDNALLYENINNIIAFIPLGMLVAGVSKRAKINCIWTMLLSGMIETLQLYFGCGVFEVSDIIENTLGAFIGNYIYMCVARWIRNREGRE